MLEHATRVWAPESPATSLELLAPVRLMTVSGVALLAIVAACAWLFGRSKRAPDAGPTWDCGYAAPTNRMQYTSSSFAGMLVGIFGWALRPRATKIRLATLFPAPARFHSEVPDTVLDRAILPATRTVARGLVWWRWVQHGNVQLYLLYVLAALVAALLFLRG